MKDTLQQKVSTPHPELLARSLLPTAKSSGRSFAFGVLGFILFLTLMVLALEIFFNFAGIGNEEFVEPDAVLGVRHIAGKQVVWRMEGYSSDRLSSQGLRDVEHSIAKPANTFRIALLGDSVVEGLQVPLPNTFGQQLQALLNAARKAIDKHYEVINFGCSSYGSGQEMIQLENVVAKYKPDLVILTYNRGDYLDNIRNPASLKAEPRTYYHLSDNGKLLEDNLILDLNKQLFQPHPVIDFLRRNSRIYGVLSHLNFVLSLNEPLYSKLKNSILKRSGGASALPFASVTPPYTIKDAWQVTETILQRINNDCHSLGARFMIVAFPNTVNDKTYNEQLVSLASLAKHEKFMFRDLTPDFVYSKDPQALFIKYHFSSAGHKLVANKIFDALR